jgi:Fe-S-cluster-containing dehydrogenase component
MDGVLDAAPHAHQESDYRADQKNDEKDFRDAGSADRDSAKAKNCSNQGDYEEDGGIVKHDRNSCIGQYSAEFECPAKASAVQSEGVVGSCRT